MRRRAYPNAPTLSNVNASGVATPDALFSALSARHDRPRYDAPQLYAPVFAASFITPASKT